MLGVLEEGASQRVYYKAAEHLLRVEAGAGLENTPDLGERGAPVGNMMDNAEIEDASYVESGAAIAVTSPTQKRA